MVVDDGSNDHTLSLIATKQLQYPDIQIIIITHLVNRGPGAANKTLFESSRKLNHINTNLKWLITVDADNQMNIADTAKFIDIIQDV